MGSNFAMSDFVVGIGVTGAILGFVVYVIDKTKTTLGSASANVNATFENGIAAVKDSTDWFSILVVAGMGTVAIGLLMNGLGRRA